jgi:hypothetical protein
MSNSEFDLDEALDTVAEARERKQKRRDALIEFALSRGMVGDNYDGKHGEAGSRDQDAPYPEPLQEEIDTDDVGKAAKVEMAMSLVEDDGMDTDEAKAMVGL